MPEGQTRRAKPSGSLGNSDRIDWGRLRCAFGRVPPHVRAIRIPLNFQQRIAAAFNFGALSDQPPFRPLTHFDSTSGRSIGKKPSRGEEHWECCSRRVASWPGNNGERASKRAESPQHYFLLLGDDPEQQCAVPQLPWRKSQDGQGIPALATPNGDAKRTQPIATSCAIPWFDPNGDDELPLHRVRPRLAGGSQRKQKG